MGAEVGRRVLLNVLALRVRNSSAFNYNILIGRALDVRHILRHTISDSVESVAALLHAQGQLADSGHAPHRLLGRDESLAGPPVHLLPLRNHLVDFDVAIAAVCLLICKPCWIHGFKFFDTGRARVEGRLVHVEEATAVAPQGRVRGGPSLLARVDLDHLHVIGSV